MSEEKNTIPSFYAIIPATVRYDTRLTPNAKLLYGEITALCNKKGVCWAGNEYFAELYKVSKVSISKWIANLVECGYIKTEFVYREGTKEILNRYITILNDPLKEKFNTPLRKVNDPLKEKFKDNNTMNITMNNTMNKYSGFDLILSEIENPDLRELYYEFLKMRKLRKSPMTELALKMLINKVNELAPDDEETQKKLLQESILHNWQSVYPLKEEQAQPKQKPYGVTSGTQGTEASYDLAAATEYMNTTVPKHKKRK